MCGTLETMSRDRSRRARPAAYRDPAQEDPLRAGGNSGAFPPRRAERLRAVLERDGCRCIWCGRAFTDLVPPTTEHVVPRVKGGPSWLANEVAACRRCNAERGHRSPVDWLEECSRRGWEPDGARLVRALTGLEAAIAVTGGQRRARPYLDAQLRRLARRGAALSRTAGRELPA